MIDPRSFSVKSDRDLHHGRSYVHPAKKKRDFEDTEWCIQQKHTFNIYLTFFGKNSPVCRLIYQAHDKKCAFLILQIIL